MLLDRVMVKLSGKSMVKSLNITGINGEPFDASIDLDGELLRRFESGHRTFTSDELNTYINVRKGDVVYNAKFKTHIKLWYTDIPSNPTLTVE